MKLSSDDMTLFYKLMWPLQFYVNQQLKILPEVTSLEAYIKETDSTEKLKVRDALYENIELLDAFVAENPAQFTPEELAITQSWQHFVRGDFYVERFLKKGAILIGSGDPPRVYMVQGLTDSLQDTLAGYYRPPIVIKTVLLPFKGQIIYDGLLQTYNVFFGGGIRGDLRETYMAAKQNGRIIETLDPKLQAQQRQKSRARPTRDWRAETDALVKAAKELKGGQVPIQSEAFSLLRASAALAQAAAHDLDDLDTLWKLEKRVQRALGKLETVLYRAEM
jgi:hypothetical protein